MTWQKTYPTIRGWYLVRITFEDRRVTGLMDCRTGRPGVIHHLTESGRYWRCEASECEWWDEPVR